MFKETMQSVEKLASGCFLVLDGKSELERLALLAKAETLTDAVTDVIAADSPVVAVLALLMAARIYEHHVSEQAKLMRAIGE